MTTVVRNTGWVDWERNTGKRTVVENSVGETFVVYMDPNNSAPLGPYGDKTNVTKIYVYQATNADKTNWTLRATINAPAGTSFVDDMQGSFSVDVGPGDKLHIIAKGMTGWVYYCTVTYSTWAVSAWETVATSSGLTWQSMDISVSEAGAPLVALFYTTTTSGDWAGVKLFLRRLTPATWAQVNQQIGSAGAGAIRPMTHDVTVAWMVKGSSATDTARDFAYAFPITTASNDNGVLLYTGVLDETAGAAVTGHTLQGAYTAGDVSKTANYTYKARSTVLWAASDTKDFILSMQTYYPKPKFSVVRWKKTSGWAVTIPFTSSTSGGSASLSMGGMAQTLRSGTVTFLTNVLNSGGATWSLFGYLVNVNNTVSGAKWGSGFFYFNDQAVTSPYYVQGGGSSRLAWTSGDHSIVFGRRYTSGKYDLCHDFVHDRRAPAGHTPSQGEVVTSSTPALSIIADLDREYSQGRIKGTWELATDAAFTNDLRWFISDDTKLQKVDGTGSSGKTVILRDALSLDNELFQGTWYIRASQDGEYSQNQTFDAATTFTVSHPPSAELVAPVGYAYLAYGSGAQQFGWEFSDPYANDVQTAYQVVIERVSDGVVQYDSGKVLSAGGTHTQAFVVGDKGIDFRWKVRVWDMDDVAGDYSEYGLFTVVDPPTIVFDSPVNGGTVASALPTVNFTPSVGGGRTLMKYRFIITQGNATIYDSSWVFAPSGGWASGTALSYSAPVVVMDNNESYTYQLRVVDSMNTEGRASIQINTSWTLPSSPDSITVDFAPYNTEDQGYMNVVWIEPTPDADFRAWVVMRRDRLQDALGNDLEVGPWTEIGRIYDESIQEFKDFYAPSGYAVDYDVFQLVDRFGDQVMSAATTGVTVHPSSDGYWFIVPNNTSSVPDAFRLSSVTADSYTDEYEKEQYTIIDGGRKVDQGQHLGPTGSLTAQIRDSATQSARQKKRRLELMKELGLTTLYMRTPFGDMYKVYVNDLQVSRIAGVGTSEFCDITVPYMEVGE